MEEDDVIHIVNSHFNYFFPLKCEMKHGIYLWTYVIAYNNWHKINIYTFNLLSTLPLCTKTAFLLPVHHVSPKVCRAPANIQHLWSSGSKPGWQDMLSINAIKTFKVQRQCQTTMKDFLPNISYQYSKFGCCGSESFTVSENT